MLGFKAWDPYVMGCLLLCLVAGDLFADVPGNSRRFQISNYYAPDGNGGHTLYRSHGFSQQSATGIKTRIFILPLVELNEGQMKFIDKQGFLFSPDDTPNKLAHTISIPLTITQRLPDKTHIPAIVSALDSGLERKNYMYPAVKDPNGFPLIYPPAQSLMFPIQQMNQNREKLYQEQEALINKFKNFAPELVNLTELEISVRVGSEIIANSRYNNSFTIMGNSLAIDVTNPTIFQQNRIRQNGHEVLVAYKFRDAKTATISANFNAKKIIDSFLSETQNSMVAQKSSGWQFLGFGSRRKTLRTSFNQSVDNQFKGEEVEKTTIEMFDADDSMMAQFEADFFPALSRQSVIDNHLEAANKAADIGNSKLRDLHLKYADSIKNSDPNLEVDIAGAVASLSAGDYAGFIAKGVRWGDHRASGNSSFRRVIHQQAEINKQKSWSQARTISVQHSLTMKADTLKEKEQWADMGICGMTSYNYQVPVQAWNGWVWETRTGALPTCITEGGPAHIAGIIPGMIIVSFDGEVLINQLDTQDFLDDYEPGDRVTAKIVNFPPGQAPTYHKIDMVLSAGPPKR
ncbi:hypothetical protein AB6C52_13285 [Vibrio cyclitrophicus]